MNNMCCAGFVRQKGRKKIPSKFHLLLNKEWNPLPPSMFNEPGTVRWCPFVLGYVKSFDADKAVLRILCPLKNGKMHSEDDSG
jgi:hypothetical protein